MLVFGYYMARLGSHTSAKNSPSEIFSEFKGKQSCVITYGCNLTISRFKTYFLAGLTIFESFKLTSLKL